MIALYFIIDCRKNTGRRDANYLHDERSFTRFFFFLKLVAWFGFALFETFPCPQTCLFFRHVLVVFEYVFVHVEHVCMRTQVQLWAGTHLHVKTQD